jgi:hypothetical protein
MSIKHGLLIATVATMISFSAYAGEGLSGNEWADDCSSNTVTRDTACVGYARGLADGLHLWIKELVCIPQEVTAGQLKDVGQRYLNAHPETRHLDAARLLSTAFMDAWPCK